MKKIIALLLVLVMTLSLMACGNASGAQAGGESAGDTQAAANGGGSFRVGYGKANITPDGQVGMGGYGRSDQRLSTGVLSYLYVTCVAITDADDNTLLLYGMDLCSSGDAYKFAANVSDATGVPVDNIVMSASHTHSAPDYGTVASGQGDALNKLKKGLVKAAETAMEDRKEAKMYGGSVETEGMNFVRHYLCNDGTYCGDNFGDSSSGYAGHASEADPVLQMIKFTREGDNDVYIANFQTHPHQTGGSAKYDLSADIVGEFRAAMEQELGCEIAYFTGAGGNINSRSRIEAENQTKDWKEWGKRMAKYAQSVEYTELATGKVQSAKMEFQAAINHADDAIAGICGELRNKWNKGEITTAQVKEIGLTYGIKLNSPYHAGAIASRASMGNFSSFIIQCYSFGDVGFVSAPYEMFDTSGVQIKEGSPFPMTIIAECSNGGNGYFPSQFAFDVSGGYECDTTKYVPGTAEKLVESYLGMLETHHANK